MRTRFPIRAYNGAQRLLERLGRRGADFAGSEEELLEAARRATGLNDFGGGSFREGLGVLLRAYDEEAHLTPFGRMLVGQELAGILRNRLVAEAAWRRDPKLLESELRPPVFILGLPRTGTTALHFLLAQDPANQVLEYWLGAAPGPRPPRSEWEGDPRFKQAVRALKLMYYLDPDLKAIHLLTADGPDECRHLLLQSFVDDTFDSNATIPSYTRWFHSQDMRPAYARHRDLLKLIGSPTPERRWVLKYPAHIRNLQVLLETHPEACIIQTHRDPARVLPSICSLVTGWRRLYEGEVDPRAVGRWQLEMWAGRMERGIRQRRAADPSRFFDLHFRDVAGDPVGAVKRAYRHFGFELGEGAERRMRAWLAENPQGKHGGHRYAPEDFGLDEAAMAERFAAYLEHFQLEREAGS